MSGLVFVDTNVLVYARDASEAEKQPRAQAWLTELWRSRRGRLSVQVLEEYYVVVTGKLSPGLPVAHARKDVRELWTWRPAPLDSALLELAWSMQDRHRLSFWDALVVAAAKQLRCEYLLTEDLQEGHVLDGVAVISPFEHDPASVLGAAPPVVQGEP